MVDINVTDAFPSNEGDLDRWNFAGDQSPQPPAPPDSFDFSAIPMQNNFTWEMIGLGLEEPLPPQESIDELSGIPPTSYMCRGPQTNTLQSIVIRSTLRRSTLPCQ